jgi:hypothetical protein
MSNALYSVYCNGIWTNAAAVDWTSDTIKAVLCSAGYTPNIAADAHITDIPGGDIVSTATVTGLSVASRAVQISGTVTFASVTGAVCTQVVLYKDTGTPSTSPLLALFDTFTSGMPATPVGTNIVLTLDASGIASL